MNGTCDRLCVARIVIDQERNVRHCPQLYISCRRSIDTQSHVMICPAYRKLREGKDAGNDKDLVEYLVEVMKIRERMGFRK